LAQKIAIFASGSGSNAEKIIEYFADNRVIDVSLILSNNPKAYVIERARSKNVPSSIFSRPDFYNSEVVLTQLKDYEIDWIVLAGFLWLIPESLIAQYPERIINIHPALLPKYGGKGMYGHHVHQAVFDNFEKETGITIHLVNKEYDKGRILFQKKTTLEVNDTPDRIAQKIHLLEHNHFPQVIEDTIIQG
jgi:phosphoribosylglycinamide formyltransferase 1